MPKFWRGGRGLAIGVAGLALALAAQAQEWQSEKAQEPLVLHARVREPGKAGTAGSFVVKEKILRVEARANGHHHLRHVEPALVPGGDPAGRRAGPGDEPDDRRGAGQGRLIIHAPSSCMDAYKDHPARKRAQAAPKAANLPAAYRRVVQQDPGRGEGDLPDRPVRRRLRRRAAVPPGLALEVADRRHRDPRRGRHQRLGRRDLEPAGKPRDHQRACSWAFIPICACSAGRSACGTSSGHGKNVVLVRDLTDTMYNSRMWPYVSHFEGTNRIVEHIEKYVAPTITSTDLTGQPRVPVPARRPPPRRLPDRRG